MLKVIDATGKHADQVTHEIKSYLDEILNHGTVSYTEGKTSNNWYEPDNQGELDWDYEGSQIVIDNFDFDVPDFIPEIIEHTFDVTDDIEIRVAAQWQDDNIWKLILI